MFNNVLDKDVDGIKLPLSLNRFLMVVVSVLIVLGIILGFSISRTYFYLVSGAFVVYLVYSYYHIIRYKVFFQFVFPNIFYSLASNKIKWIIINTLLSLLAIWFFASSAINGFS